MQIYAVDAYFGGPIVGYDTVPCRPGCLRTVVGGSLITAGGPKSAEVAHIERWSPVGPNTIPCRPRC